MTLTGSRSIGNYASFSDVNMAGNFAEFGIWNAVLSAADVAALNAGYAPSCVRSGALRDYLPLIGRTSPEINHFGTAGTLTGATVADHPRIIYPSKQRVIVAAVTPPPAAAGFRSRVAGGFAIG